MEKELGLGLLIMVAVTVIVGAVLLTTIASQIAESTELSDGVNLTVTCPADGVAVDMVGAEYISGGGIVVVNDTSEIVAAGNYTVTEGVSATTSIKTILYTAVGSEYEGELLNLTYEYGGDGYMDDSASRAVTGLILIFFSLAIAVVALTPTLRSKVLDMVK